jgi:hypothetical protein
LSIRFIALIVRVALALAFGPELFFLSKVGSRNSTKTPTRINGRNRRMFGGTPGTILGFGIPWREDRWRRVERAAASGAIRAARTARSQPWQLDLGEFERRL